MDMFGFNVPFNMPQFGIGTGNIIWILIILVFVMFGAIVMFLLYQWKNMGLW